MKIGTREATRYLRALLGICPYFHIYCSIQVKFGVEDLYLVFFFQSLWASCQAVQRIPYTIITIITIIIIIIIITIIIIIIITVFRHYARYLHFYT